MKKKNNNKEYQSQQQSFSSQPCLKFMARPTRDLGS